jgi:hypothetical protein
VTCRLLDRARKFVFGAGNIPLPPFNVGPPGVANCAGTGEGPKDAGAGIPTEVPLLLPAFPLLLPELVLVPVLPPLIFGVTPDPDGIDEVPPPLAHAAVLNARAIPAK